MEVDGNESVIDLTSDTDVSSQDDEEVPVHAASGKSKVQKERWPKDAHRNTHDKDETPSATVEEVDLGD